MKRLLIAIAASAAIAAGASSHHTAIKTDRHGAITAIDADSPTIHLIFTADSLCEGFPHILSALRRHNVKASFFVTGNFLRDTTHTPLINKIIADGHYLGPHSDRHILLADWDDARTPLATPDSAVADIEANYTELSRFGIDRHTAPYIVPPYEWYNRVHIDAYTRAGLKPISPTPGIQTYRDYTTPDMPDYHTADSIWNQLLDRETTHTLNGAIIIIHPGTQDIRTDKFYLRLDTLIDTLTARGYHFAPMPGSPPAK